MVDYTSVNTVKTYLHISSTAHDTLLGDLVTRASRLIDDHCGRWFVAQAGTRYFDAVGSQISGRMLLLDADLLSLTTLVNGDGATIPAEDVILRPVNWAPYFAISLKHGTSHRWGYINTPEAAIAVTGQWGYAPTAPEAITQAAIRLTAWLYRQRDTGGEGTHVATTSRGVAHPPPRLPRDVVDLLGPYVRLRIRSMA